MKRTLHLKMVGLLAAFMCCMVTSPVVAKESDGGEDVSKCTWITNVPNWPRIAGTRLFQDREAAKKEEWLRKACWNYVTIQKLKPFKNRMGESLSCVDRYHPTPVDFQMVTIEQAEDVYRLSAQACVTCTAEIQGANIDLDGPDIPDDVRRAMLSLERYYGPVLDGIRAAEQQAIQKVEDARGAAVENIGAARDGAVGRIAVRQNQATIAIVDAQTGAVGKVNAAATAGEATVAEATKRGSDFLDTKAATLSRELANQLPPNLPERLQQLDAFARTQAKTDSRMTAVEQQITYRWYEYAVMVLLILVVLFILVVRVLDKMTAKMKLLASRLGMLEQQNESQTPRRRVIPLHSVEQVDGDGPTDSVDGLESLTLVDPNINAEGPIPPPDGHDGKPVPWLVEKVG